VYWLQPSQHTLNSTAAAREHAAVLRARGSMLKEEEAVVARGSVDIEDSMYGSHASTHRAIARGMSLNRSCNSFTAPRLVARASLLREVGPHWRFASNNIMARYW
jgi:hypothetical protein